VVRRTLTIFSLPGTAGNWWANDATTTTTPACEFLFTGRQYDPETGNYWYRARYYQPMLGRFLSRDQIIPNDSYEYVGSLPIEKLDPSGLQHIHSHHEPKPYPPVPPNDPPTACHGKCGTIADDWVAAELAAQVQGWNAYKEKNPEKNDFDGYIKWANGNQRYKDPDYFRFNSGSNCGTGNCGYSVTFCGHCVRTKILGNIAFGYVGESAGFTVDKIIEGPYEYKNRWNDGMLTGFVPIAVDPYDRYAFGTGSALYRSLNGKPPQALTANNICAELDFMLARSTGRIWREAIKGGGYLDLGPAHK